MTEGDDSRVDPGMLAGLNAYRRLAGPDGLAGIVDIAERRRRHAALVAAAGEVDRQGVEVVEHDAHGTPVRCYLPGARPRSCVLVYVHGGGLVFGSPSADDGACVALAREFDAVVVSVDYRLAPEHDYLAAVEDVVRAVRWAIAQAVEWEYPARLVMYGVSAGGGLAIAAAHRLRAAAGSRPLLVVVGAPMLDDADASVAQATPPRGTWSAQADAQSWAMSLRGLDDAQLSEAVPARLTDLTGLPPVYMDVGGLDLFHEQVVFFAGRLSESGVEVDLAEYPGAFHGGESIAPQSELALRILTARYRAVHKALSTVSGGAA